MILVTKTSDQTRQRGHTLSMYVCMVRHIARVWINRVRLPIPLVVSRMGKMNISLSAFMRGAECFCLGPTITIGGVGLLTLFFVRYRWLRLTRATGLNGSRVFTLSRLKTDACGETWFAAGRFTVPEKVCGFITVWFYKYRLSLRVGFGPVCTQQHLYSRTATPPMHTPSPQ